MGTLGQTVSVFSYGPGGAFDRSTLFGEELIVGTAKVDNIGDGRIEGLYGGGIREGSVLVWDTDSLVALDASRVIGYVRGGATPLEFQVNPGDSGGVVLTSSGDVAAFLSFITSLDGTQIVVASTLDVNYLSTAFPSRNALPTFIKTEVSLPENSVGPVALMLSDPDGDPVAVTAIGGADAGRFKIVNGVLELSSPADFEVGLAPLQLSVTISDGKSDGLTTAAVVVSITNVNERPVFTQPVGPFVVTKGAVSGAVVGQVGAVDPEADPLT